MASPTAAELKKQVVKLQTERQDHQKAIVEIDSVFADLGIKLSVPAKRGPKPGKRKVGRPKAVKAVAKKKPGRPKKKAGRSKTARPKSTGPKITAGDLITQMLKAGGKAGAKGSELGLAWKKMGGNRSNVTSQLVALRKAGKISKKKVKGARDSVYRLA